MLEGEATGLRGLAATEPRALPSSPAPAPPPPPRGPESQPILQQLATLPSHAAPARAPDPRDGGAGLCCPVELDHQSGDLGGAQRTSEPAPCLLTPLCLRKPSPSSAAPLPGKFPSMPSDSSSCSTKLGPRAEHASGPQTAHPACKPTSRHEPLLRIAQGPQCSPIERGFVLPLPSQALTRSSEQV